MHAWALDQAQSIGVDDFSTYVRMLIKQDQDQKKNTSKKAP